jgi:hypothetical protein
MEFKNINAAGISRGSVFYLYGNNKKTFNVFCNFVVEELRKKFSEVRVTFCSIAECVNILDGQCDLFDTGLSCFCIKNIEDNHQKKVEMLLNEKNSVFMLESGSYLKSKKITDHMAKSRALAVASFNNEPTLNSLVQMFFPDTPQTTRNEITKILANVDEELFSFFSKLSLLSPDVNLDDVQNCSSCRQSFLRDLAVVPLIRFLLQSVIKVKIMKQSGFNWQKSVNDGAIHHLLKAELLQKSGMEVSRGSVYQGLLPSL